MPLPVAFTRRADFPARRRVGRRYALAGASSGRVISGHPSDRGRDRHANAAFHSNPVLVIVSFVFWFWMWRVPGAILSVPTLAITKIICDRVQPLAALGHFLEG
jgi:hypothetical protein